MWIWCEIVCRECSNTTQGLFVSGQIPKRGMKKAAKQQGWLFEHGESFCSEFCLGKFDIAVNYEKYIDSFTEGK